MDEKHGRSSAHGEEGTLEEVRARPGSSEAASQALSRAPRQGASLMRSAHVASDAPDAVPQLFRDLGDDLALAILFVSPRADFSAVMDEANLLFAGTQVLGCTTAGEIAGGYVEDGIVGIGLPRSHFEASVITIENLDEIAPTALIEHMIRTRRDLEKNSPDFENEFAFLLVDGTSLREDALMNVLARGLGPVPLFGGSAGDGTRFRQSLLFCDGKVHKNAALLTFLRTRCPIKVFSFNHLDPADQRMVVTRANAAARRVQEINAAPAAREYARILGKDQTQLDPFTFAAHPLVVRIGGRYHVRSIQRVDGDDLIFFSAIDEGVVLTLAEPREIAQTLAEDFETLNQGGRLDGILACDCILRRIEAHQKQRSLAVSDVLRRNRVVGFSTYGEQFGAMHVNLTMTGVAIYAPEDD